MSERLNVSQDTRIINQSQNMKNLTDVDLYVFFYDISETDNEEHKRQMKNLETLQKELVQVKRKLNDASIRCHKLNIDVATMFNPETLTTLEAYKEQCDICLARMSQTLHEPLDDVVCANEKRSATEENSN